MSEQLSGGYEGLGLTPEQEALDRKDAELCDALGAAGWMFAGSGPNIGIGKPGEVGMTLALPADVRELTESDAEGLLRDIEAEGEQLLPGWSVLPADMPESDGYVGISYDGPIDASFERGVQALVGFAQPPATS